MSAGDEALYFDSSALVKLVLKEPESADLEAWLRRRTGMQQVSSALARTELRRAVLGHPADALTAVVERLRKLSLVATTNRLLDEAGQMGAPVLRSLDAIHLASALRLGQRLSAIVTYDHRMIAAAEALKLPVAHPGMAG